MEKKKLGRKPLPAGEKKLPLTIHVKAKHSKQAIRQLKELEAQYNAKP